jgi:hypothetical protein
MLESETTQTVTWDDIALGSGGSTLAWVSATVWGGKSDWIASSGSHPLVA